MENNKIKKLKNTCKPYIKLDFLEHKWLFSNAKAQLSNGYDTL